MVEAIKPEIDKDEKDLPIEFQEIDLPGDELIADIA
jgi:hypothetical protein